MIGTGELILILCVALLLFGGKKLPEFAKNLGRGIREFKRSCNGLDEEVGETHIDSTPKNHDSIKHDS